MTYSEGEREREKERERERERGRGRERGREEKTGDGFVITESFSYLCMRDRYLDRQTNKQDKHCPPAHKN